MRFSGGEPTLYRGLRELIRLCDQNNVKHIALSTNGSADLSLYQTLVSAGVNDFSISLDACCSSTGDTMTGKQGAWGKVIENIQALSQMTYVTVGIVLNEANVNEAAETVKLAHQLGVADIRVIPSAQFNQSLSLGVAPELVEAHPILRYRLGNDWHVRGITEQDSHKCKLVLDDMAVWDNHHYPCIIYLREQGLPIGKMGGNVRQERLEWYKRHNTWEDRICRENCLDVCVDFNNKAEEK